MSDATVIRAALTRSVVIQAAPPVPPAFPVRRQRAMPCGQWLQLQIVYMMVIYINA